MFDRHAQILLRPALNAAARGLVRAGVNADTLTWLGFAIGIASHGIGTARAFQVNEQSGAFAALAMGMNGALTALLVPWIATYLINIG